MDKKQRPEYEKRLHLTKEQRLPRCFKDAEKVIKTAKSCKSNFKTVLANSRFRGSHYKKVYSLTFNVLKHYEYIQKIIDKLQLLEKEKLLRREIASILIYEILFGTGSLPGESKPVVTIQQYADSIMSLHEELQNSGNHDSRGFDLPRYARVHTLVTTVPYVIKDLESLGFEQLFYDEAISEEQYIQLVKNMQKKSFMVDFHFKDILVFVYNENLTNLELYKKGHIFLQDKSSYLPIHALNPEPGSAVLDACAAPGMKSVHIASKMENKGVLIACELKKDRFETLKEMLQHGAVKISKMFCKDFKLIDPNDQAFSSIDYILLDPSCSGSGMVNRMDEVTDTEDSKTKERLEKLAGFQIVLLKHALKFPSVKRIVYSTCSVHEEENEYVVHEALKAFNFTFKLVPVMPEWSVRGSKNYKYGELCLRTDPEKNLTNGFFVAMFERLNDTERYENQISGERCKKSRVDKRRIGNNRDSEIVNSRNSYESTKKSKKEDIHDPDISNIMNEESETIESHFDSSFTKKRKKKNRSTLALNVEMIKDDQVHESHIDSSFIKKKKHCAKDENETSESHFDSISARKKRKKGASEFNTCDAANNYKVDCNLYKNNQGEHSSFNEYAYKNSEDVDICNSKHKKKRKNKEIKNEFGDQSICTNVESVANLHIVQKEEKSKKYLTSSSNLEMSDVAEQTVFQPSNLLAESEFTTIPVCDNAVVKLKKKHKDQSVSISSDVVEGSGKKHKKKKHKKHSRDNFDGESKLLVNKGNMHDDSDKKNIDAEEKYSENTSECLLQTVKNTKKKHKKHSKERDNNVGENEPSFAINKNAFEEFNEDKVNLETENVKSKSDCLLTESVDFGSVKKKKKKHKRHSKNLESDQCVEESKNSDVTNVVKENVGMKDSHDEVVSLSQLEAVHFTTNVSTSPKRKKHKKHSHVL